MLALSLAPQRAFANIHSLLILRRDRLVYERYFPGIDENREGSLGLVHHSRDTLHDVRSVTKSERRYGCYQIWRFSFLSDGRRIQIIELSGNGGQKVLLDEARQTIIVVTAGNYDRTDLKKWPLDMYTDFILPAFKSQPSPFATAVPVVLSSIDDRR